MAYSMLWRVYLALMFLACTAYGQLSDCHAHGTVQYCVGPDGKDTPVPASTPAPTATPTAAASASATPTSSGRNCHFDNGVEHCEDHASESSATPSAAAAAAGGQNCHFHAGVEHCGDDEASPSTRSCERVDRNYNVGLRVGALFVVLCTSSIGAFGPLIIQRLLKVSFDGIIFTIIKQFGTGVIISTAYVHLLTHAHLLFSNECVGELKYEAVTTAIAMAGIFISFIIDFAAARFLALRAKTSTLDNGSDSTKNGVIGVSDPHGHSHAVPAGKERDKLSVLVLEAGIIFHSIIIGISLVVAADSYLITLWIVIIFHQMFEGLALGALIAALPRETTKLLTKLLMAAAFALVTPVGMAIGIGVRRQFNGRDRSTLIALATFDAFSAGILVWIGLVEMLAHDWLFGYLKGASTLKVAVALASLVLGAGLMALLARWA